MPTLQRCIALAPYCPAVCAILIQQISAVSVSPYDAMLLAWQEDPEGLCIILGRLALPSAPVSQILRAWVSSCAT